MYNIVYLYVKAIKMYLCVKASKVYIYMKVNMYKKYIKHTGYFPPHWLKSGEEVRYIWQSLQSG